MKRFLMSLVLMLTIVVPACAQSVLVCTFEKNATVKREPSGEFSVEGGTGEAIVLEPGGLDSETIVLAGLDSVSPVLRGNLGEY